MDEPVAYFLKSWN